MKEDILDLSDLKYAVMAHGQQSSSSYQSVEDGLVPYEEVPAVHSSLDQVVHSVVEHKLHEHRPVISAKKQAFLARISTSARERYHKMSPEERREFNRNKTSQKEGKKVQERLQRKRECSELNDLLRETGHLYCSENLVFNVNPVEEEKIAEQLAKKRARWAAESRKRYHNMTVEERRLKNSKRRIRERNRAINEAKETVTAAGDTSLQKATKEIMKRNNAQRAARARARYHRMSDEEKKQYNAKRMQLRRDNRLREAISVLALENNCHTPPSDPNEEMISADAEVSAEIDNISSRERRMAHRIKVKEEVGSQELISPPTVTVPSVEMISGEASVSGESGFMSELAPHNVDQYPQMIQGSLNFFADLDQYNFKENEEPLMEYQANEQSDPLMFL